MLIHWVQLYACQPVDFCHAHKVNRAFVVEYGEDDVVRAACLHVDEAYVAAQQLGDTLHWLVLGVLERGHLLRHRRRLVQCDVHGE